MIASCSDIVVTGESGGDGVRETLIATLCDATADLLHSNKQLFTHHTSHYL